MQRPTRTTYRPRVAAALTAAGITCRPCPNVFHPEKMCWEYENSPEAARIVARVTAEAKNEKERAGK